MRRSHNLAKSLLTECADFRSVVDKPQMSQKEIYFLKVAQFMSV